MADAATIWAAHAAVLIMLGAVLGTVYRRERFVFVAGVLLVLVAVTFLRGTAGAALGTIGILAAVGAALPMLREVPSST